MKSLTLSDAPRPSLAFTANLRKAGRFTIAAINFIWDHPLLMLLIAFGVFCTVCGSLAYAWFFGGNS